MIRALLYVVARLFISRKEWDGVKVAVANRLDPLPVERPDYYVPASREELRAYQRIQTL